MALGKLPSRHRRVFASRNLRSAKRSRSSVCSSRSCGTERRRESPGYSCDVDAAAMHAGIMDEFNG